MNKVDTKRAILEATVLAFILTAGSYLLGIYLQWIEELNYLEVFAVFTSYACTWLCTRQSRWNYPIGIVTTAAYSFLFYSAGMLSLSVFNLYLVFALIYGWFRWGSDSDTRPVTSIKKPSIYLGYGFFGLIVLGLFIGINWLFNGGEMNPIDVGLAVASGVAQLLLDNKRLQTWSLWAIVDIVSIPFFLTFGLTLVAFQYVFFLLNTLVGHVAWKRSMVQ